MKIWSVISVVCVIAIVILIYGRIIDKEEVIDKTEFETRKASESEAEGKIRINVNPLTGVNDMSEEGMGKRPVAVMINNVDDSMPQYGIEQASIIYEVPVEGDLTRLMALYADYTTLPQICSIRSCRYYFPAISEGYDAYYIHWGSDQTILDYLDSLDLDRFDGLTGSDILFGRDETRLDNGYDLEHTAYFNGENFSRVIEQGGIRTELDENKTSPVFSFTEEGEVRKYEGQVCETVTIDFGSSTSEFIYDKEEGVYKKMHNENPHIDGGTGNQLEFTNVFIFQTSISIRDEVGHKEIDWAGSQSAKGYYISNGMKQEIRWYKEGGIEKGRLIVTDVTGEELIINSGKSYIGYTSKDI